MTYQDVYRVLVDILKSQGWTVIIDRLEDGVNARLFFQKKLIKVDRRIPWSSKVKALAHEMGHIQQCGVKKWNYMLAHDKLPDTKINRKYVEAFEVDASKRGAKILKKLGLEDVDYEEFHEKYLKQFRPQWYEEYLE
jgi:hypothetical protein